MPVVALDQLAAHAAQAQVDGERAADRAAADDQDVGVGGNRCRWPAARPSTGTRDLTRGSAANDCRSASLPGGTGAVNAPDARASARAAFAAAATMGARWHARRSEGTVARRLTLRDVARRVGIHPATASRALNDSTRHLVSAETATRVAEAAREMGYTPNSIARSLKTNRSLTVGVILPDLTNPLFPPMVRGIEDALLPAGFTALLASTDNDHDRARAVIEALRLRQVDGWISAIATLDDRPVRRARRRRSCCSTARTRTARRPSSATTTTASRRRSSTSIALGHRRIAYVAGPQALSTGRARYRAYRADGCAPDGGCELVWIGDVLHRARGRARRCERCSTAARASRRCSPATT